MKSFLLSSAALSFALVTPAFGQAYKCVINGTAVFQQHPCPGGQKLDVPVPASSASRDAQVANAIAVGEVRIGMTQEEVIRAWGRPDKINRTVTASTNLEQWIYERGSISNRQYLYIENGRLRSFQSP